MPIKAKATDILWDAAAMKSGQPLPTEVELPHDMTETGEVTKYLAELTGYHARGFTLIRYRIFDVQSEFIVNGRRVTRDRHLFTVYDESGTVSVGSRVLGIQDPSDNEAVAAAIEKAMEDVRWWRKPDKTMSIQELTSVFMAYQQNNPDTPMIGYVVFKPESFPRHKHLTQRTFRVYSNSPCFMPIPNDGHQLWGENMSHPEDGPIRLDLMMQNDYWLVDYCYLDD